MPLYTYRREDGTTFDIKQSFSDPALTVDPETGQHVTRVVYAAGIVFKGSGFYVNDSKSSGRNSATSPVKEKSADAPKTDGAKSDAPAASTGGESTPAKAETKTETKTASKSAAD
jgi:predicted nucleic acid-binding Zn ribbon protein